MYSMTGYGKGVASADGREMTVELKSVNHRFLDLGIRLPRQLNCIEDTLRKVLGDNLSRGHIDVFVNYRNTRSDSKAVSVDAALLRAYINAAHEANSVLQLEDDLTLATALRLPDVTEIISSDDDADALANLTEIATINAVCALKDMRKSEGMRMRQDLLDHLTVMETLTAQIEERAPYIVQDYRVKLNDRIEKALCQADIDKARLATEVALFADRAAVDEELARLKSHHEQFHTLLDADEPVGRKLDFVIQEMNRECNTIGSKANDAQLTQLILQCKCEIEKLREQIQNIE